MERLMLTVDEVAESLGIGKSAVYDLMRLRKLASVKIRRSRRVPVEALHTYVLRPPKPPKASQHETRQW